MNIYSILIQILTLTGALVLFLYGMKVMSESLQKLAGRNMRNILARITSKPSRGILTGFLITSLIQSSSATTVLLVSFVNAGLVSFAESIGIIFGANIGTTITAWLISFVGLGNQLSIYSIILPLVALSLPFFFSYNNKNKARAEFVIGFAMLFIGILFFRENLPEIDKNSEIFQSLNLYDSSFVNTLIFIGLGILVTIIFQSSSATITLTMVLAMEGWLPFSAALAMVVGENIGTTVTALVAAIMANRSARRTALAHLLFNVIGLLWVLPFIGIIAETIQSAMQGFNIQPSHLVPFGVSVFHTSFNIVNVILLTIFLKPFKNLCLMLMPGGNGMNEVFTLKYINNSLLSTSELSILQVRKEIAHMGKQVSMLFSMVPDLLLEKKEKKFAKKFRKLQKGEETIDEMEIEIAGYITKLSEMELSEQGNMRIKTMLKIIDYLESIADLCFQMALTIMKKKEANAWFTQELRNNLAKEWELIEKSLNLMVHNLDKDYLDVEIDEAERIENEINRTRSELKKAYLEEINREKLPYKTGVYYNDLLSLSEKVGNYAYSINMAMYRDDQYKSMKFSEKKQQKK
mgnify:CR=1 FL=1